MSKAVKAIKSMFGGVPKAPDVSRNASQIGGEMTPEQMAARRAALGAQGRRLREDEIGMGVQTRPLQGSGRSSMWS